MEKTNGATTAHPSTIYIKLTLTALFWGGTFVAGRLVSATMSPLMAAAVRYLIASLALLTLVFLSDGRLAKLTKSQALLTLLLGLTGVFAYNFLFFGALSEMPASRTAIFVALSPIIVATVHALLAREIPSVKKIIGIVSAFLGALIVLSRGDLAGMVRDITTTFGKGEMFMTGAVFAWVAYTIIGRRALAEISPLIATTYAALWGLAFFAITLLIFPAQFQISSITWSAGALLFYIAIVGTVIPFIWYYEGVKQVGPTRAAIFGNLVPFFGVTLGALLLNEPLGLSMLIGGIFIVLGVALTSKD